MATIARCFNDKIRARNEHFYRSVNIYFNTIANMYIERESIYHSVSSILCGFVCMCACERHHYARACNAQVHLAMPEQKVTTSTKVLWNLSKIVLAGRWLLILSACTLRTRIQLNNGTLELIMPVNGQYA